MGSKKDQLIINKSLLEAVATGSFAKIKELVDSGADPHYKDELGWGVIHYAAFTGNSKVVEYFIKRRVDVNGSSSDGTFPIVVASARGHDACVLSMLAGGAKVNVQDRHTGNTPIMFACEAKSVDLVKRLIASKANLDIKNHDGVDAIGFVRKLNNEEVLSIVEKVVLERSLGSQSLGDGIIGFVGTAKSI